MRRKVGAAQCSERPCVRAETVRGAFCMRFRGLAKVFLWRNECRVRLSLVRSCRNRCEMRRKVGAAQCSERPCVRAETVRGAFCMRFRGLAKVFLWRNECRVRLSLVRSCRNRCEMRRKVGAAQCSERPCVRAETVRGSCCMCFRVLAKDVLWRNECRVRLSLVRCRRSRCEVRRKVGAAQCSEKPRARELSLRGVFVCVAVFCGFRRDTLWRNGCRVRL